MRAENVIDADYDANAIEKSMLKALEDKDFNDICRTCSNPYGQGNAGANIAKVVAEVPLDDQFLVKRMTLEGIVSNGWYK